MIGETDEVLGQVQAEIVSVVKNLKLTPQEQQKQLTQIAENKIRISQENQKLEEEQYELFGLKPIDPSADTMFAFVNPHFLKNLMVTYFAQQFDKELNIQTNETILLQLTTQEKQQLLEIFDNDHYRKSHRKWYEFLKNDHPQIRCVFETAQEKRNAMLINSHHPIIKEATQIVRALPNMHISLQTSSNHEPQGIYPFGIYFWKQTGIMTSSEVKIFWKEQALDFSVEHILTAKFVKEGTLPTNDDITNIERQHHQVWQQELKQYQDHAQKKVSIILERTDQSCQEKIKQAQQILANNPPSKIQTMKEKEITNLQQKQKSQQKHLETLQKTSDITFTCLAYGILEVIPV